MTSSPVSHAWALFVRQMGDNLSRIREEQGLSQEEVARDAGISRQTYQRLEHGRVSAKELANPRLFTLLSVASALDAELGDIVPSPEANLFNDEAEIRRLKKEALRPRRKSEANRVLNQSQRVGPETGVVKETESGPWHDISGARFP